MQMTGGEEELLVYRSSRMVLSIPPHPPRESATPYGTRPPTRVPPNYGRYRTPSHRLDPARMEEARAEPQPSPISHLPT